MTTNVLEAPAGDARPPADGDRPRRRRRHDDAYKLWVLEQAEDHKRRGQLAAFLRRERLYSSHLVLWRRWRQAQQEPPSPPPPPDPRLAELERAQAELTRRIAELQRQAAALMGIRTRPQGV